MPGTQPGLPPGSAGPCTLVPGPWAPGQANTQRRHAVLFSLQRTGWGCWPWLWLTGPTQGGHIRHQESLAKVCNSEARGKLCFAQHRATWIFIPTLCKHSGHSSRGQRKGMAAQVPFHCQGGSRLTPDQWPWPRLLWRVLPGFPTATKAAVFGDEHRDYCSRSLCQSPHKYFLT